MSRFLLLLNHHPKPLKEQIVCPLSGRERALARPIIEEATSRDFRSRTIAHNATYEGGRTADA